MEPPPLPLPTARPRPRLESMALFSSCYKGLWQQKGLSVTAILRRSTESLGYGPTNQGGDMEFFCCSRLDLSFARSIALVAILIGVSGCGHLPGGDRWGERAIYPVDWKRIPRA